MATNWRTFKVHYTAEHGNFGTRCYTKTIREVSEVCARAKFNDYMKKKDEKQGRWGAFRRWYCIDGIEEVTS